MDDAALELAGEYSAEVVECHSPVGLVRQPEAGLAAMEREIEDVVVDVLVDPASEVVLELGPGSHVPMHVLDLPQSLEELEHWQNRASIGEVLFPGSLKAEDAAPLELTFHGCVLPQRVC